MHCLPPGPRARPSSWSTSPAPAAHPSLSPLPLPSRPLSGPSHQAVLPLPMPAACSGPRWARHPDPGSVCAPCPPGTSHPQVLGTSCSRAVPALCPVPHTAGSSRPSGLAFGGPSSEGHPTVPLKRVRAREAGGAAGVQEDPCILSAPKTALPASRRVGPPPTPSSSGGCRTPAGCPAISFRSDPVSWELAGTPQVQVSVPRDRPHLRHQSPSPDCHLCSRLTGYEPEVPTTPARTPLRPGVRDLPGRLRTRGNSSGVRRLGRYEGV